MHTFTDSSARPLPPPQPPRPLAPPPRVAMQHIGEALDAGLLPPEACEALFDAGLSPKRSSHTVQGERAERLAATIRQVLDRALQAGGSSLRDYVQASGELGYFQHQFSVYGREGEPCPNCDCEFTVKRIVQSGRSTFYCAKRQR